MSDRFNIYNWDNEIQFIADHLTEAIVYVARVIIAHPCNLNRYENL